MGVVIDMSTRQVISNSRRIPSGVLTKAPSVLQSMVYDFLKYSTMMSILKEDECANQDKIEEVETKLNYLSRKIDKTTRDLF